MNFSESFIVYSRHRLALSLGTNLAICTNIIIPGGQVTKPIVKNAPINYCISFKEPQKFFDTVRPFLASQNEKKELT